VSFLIDSITGSCEIFCNADIIEYLSLVSSTAPASARYSLLREIANWINGYIKYHKIRNAIPMRGKTFHFHSLLRDLILISICHIVAIAQTKTTTTTMSKESLLMICVSSCAATASISDLFSLLINHLEKTIRDFLGCRHIAKAFKLSSSSIQILGVGSHLEIQKFSIIL